MPQLTHSKLLTAIESMLNCRLEFKLVEKPFLIMRIIKVNGLLGRSS